MNLHLFKEKMMSSEQLVEHEAPTELDPALLTLVSGGELALVNRGGGGNFANATWSKAT